MNFKTFIIAGFCTLILSSSYLRAQNSDGVMYNTDTKQTATGTVTSYYNPSSHQLVKEEERNADGKIIIRTTFSVMGKTIEKLNPEGQLTTSTFYSYDKTLIRTETVTNEGIRRVVNNNNPEDIYTYNEVIELYWPNGKIKSTTRYVPNDKAISTYDHHSAGILLTEDDLVKDGVCKNFDTDGNLNVVITYNKGKIVNPLPLQEVKEIANNVTPASEFPAGHFVADWASHTPSEITVTQATTPTSHHFIGDGYISEHTQPNTIVRQKATPTSHNFVTDSHMPENIPNNAGTATMQGYYNNRRPATVNNSINTFTSINMFTAAKTKNNTGSNNYILLKELLKRLEIETGTDERQRLFLQIEDLFENISIKDLPADGSSSIKEMSTALANLRKEIFPEGYIFNEAKAISALKEVLTEDTNNKRIDQLVDMFIKEMVGKKLDVAATKALAECIYYYVDKAEKTPQNEEYLLSAIMLSQFISNPEIAMMNAEPFNISVMNNFRTRLVDMILTIPVGEKASPTARKIEMEAKLLLEHPRLIK
ncbi:MAG: hypothetical protein WCQ47_03445 [bacterium]